MRLVRGAALVAGVGAVACIAVALRPAASTPNAAGARNTKTITPIVSARRAPLLFAPTLARPALEAALRTITGPNDACVAADDKTGELARVDTNASLLPASTIKLLTAIAALDRLGPEYRFRTAFVAGTTPGAYVLVGGGDPLLATPAYEAFRHGSPRWRDAQYTHLADLADRIKASGIRSIATLAVDDSHQDTLRYLPEWKPSYAVEGNIGAMGALTVDGGFATETGSTLAPDPAVVTGQRLADLLRGRGVTVGAVQRSVAPRGGREIASVQSPPLAAILNEMVVGSDDFTAEQLIRALGDGSTAGGTRVAREALARLGLPTSALVMHDGSGLSRRDRVTCDLLLRAVALIETPRFAVVDRALPVAARTGTLVLRFRGDALAGKVRAKSGTLDDVTGLVGVVDGADNLRFAFVANGDFSMSQGEAIGDDVVRRLHDPPDARASARNMIPAP